MVFEAVLQETKKNSPKKIVLLVDAFRAFATACPVLDQNPAAYYLTNRCSVVERLRGCFAEAVLVGKPEVDSRLAYTIPNSPTRASELDLTGQTVIHRTAAAGWGACHFRDADILLGVSFVNAKATAVFINQIKPLQLEIIPLGHEGERPTLEDDLCVSYLEAHIEGRFFKLSPYIEKLREGPGRYFFGEDQYQYPREDFDHCLAVDTFDSPIFIENRGDFAILRKRGSPISND